MESRHKETLFMTYSACGDIRSGLFTVSAPSHIFVLLRGSIHASSKHLFDWGYISLIRRISQIGDNISLEAGSRLVSRGVS